MGVEMGELGRPCLLDAELLEKAKKYLTDGFSEAGSVVPSVAGLSCYLGVSKKAIYNWSEDNEHNNNDPIRIDFIHTLAAIQAKQEMLLINGGLSQAFSGTITKLMLANHGYSDKIQAEVATEGTVEHTGSVELTLNVVSSKVER